MDNPQCESSKLHSYWIVENTGWSGKISWFRVGDGQFKSYEDAAILALKRKAKLNDKSINWRVTKITIKSEYYEV